MHRRPGNKRYKFRLTLTPDDFRLAPDVSTVLMSSLLSSYRSLGSRIVTNGNFIFSVFGVALIVAFWLIDVS